MKMMTLLGVGLVIGVCLGPASGQAPVPDGAAMVEWNPPTSYENGQDLDPATDLSGYNVYYGKASKTYDKKIPMGPGARSLLISFSAKDPATMYYFAVTAVGVNGLESAYSNEATKNVLPPKPGGCTITVR